MKFDENQALAAIRQIRVLDIIKGATTAEASQLRDALNVFGGLDMHLSSGGRLPTAWNVPRLMTETLPGLAPKAALERFAEALAEIKAADAEKVGEP